MSADDLAPRIVTGMDGVKRLIQYNAEGERVRCEVVTDQQAPALAPAPKPAPAPIPVSLFEGV